MRIEQLTFTRFIAAVAIVIFHFGKNSFLFNNDYVSFLFKQAYLGVSYFFILSGFVMVVAYGNRPTFNSRQYVTNRFARIYPVYFLAVFLFLASNVFQNINLKDLFLNLTMLQSWFPGKALTLNYPGWSISVELFFYLCFPFIFKKLMHTSLRKAAIIVVLFWVVSQLVYHLLINEVIAITVYEVKDIYYHPVMHLNEFLVGSLTGLLYLRTPGRFVSNYKNLSVILVLLVLLVLALKYPVGFNYHNGLLAILFAPLIFFISKYRGTVATLLSKSIFVFLGEISYGIYILQVPVWFLFSDYRLEKYFGIAKNPTDETFSFFVKLFILIVVSSISYKYFEGPLRRQIKKLGVLKK